MFDLMREMGLMLAQVSSVGDPDLPAGVSAAVNDSSGILHFVGQSDWVGKSLFVLLLLMSVVTWYLILVKGVNHWSLRRRSARFLARFWSATSLDEVAQGLRGTGVAEPFARLADQALRSRGNTSTLRERACLRDQGGSAAFVTRALRKVLDQETARFESGLTTLASIGSTAPFIGLLGTVWGVYHALISIGVAEGVTIGQIAGPVGEALVMTGLGLAVAIPAVLAYNGFVRINRVYLGRLDAFAHDLFGFLEEAPAAVREAPAATREAPRARPALKAAGQEA